jgi:hypothetical protein
MSEYRAAATAAAAASPQQHGGGGEYEYHFVSDAQAITSMPAVAELLVPPVLVDGRLESFHGQACSFAAFDQSTLEIGRNFSALSGTPFVSQQNSVHELLSGRRRWALYPPDRLPKAGFHPNENLDSWLRAVYPSLDAASLPVEIVQKAGEFVYVPDGWYYATTTLSSESVSIKFAPSATSRSSFLHYMNLGRAKFAEKDYKGAVKMFKLGLAMSRDYFLLQHLALAFEMSGSLEDAETLYKEATEVNPRDPHNYARLVNLLVSFSNRDESAAVSEVLQRAEKAGIQEEVLILVSSDF